MADLNDNLNESNEQASRLVDRFGNLLQTQRELNEERVNELRVARELNDVIREELNLLKGNQDFKTTTRRILGEINKLSEQNVDFAKEERTFLLDKESISKRYQRVNQSILDLSREQVFVTNKIQELENELKNSQEEENELIQEQLRGFQALQQSLAEQVITAEELRNNLSQANQASQEISQFKAPKGFDFLSKLIQDIPGLRKFSGPFEEAASKAKETAARMSKINLQALQMGKAPVFSKRQIGMQSLTSGFKALGPIITKALGPISLILMAAKALKFVVDLFIKANEQNVMISRNLGVSKETAIELREEFNLMAVESGNLLVNNQELLKAYNSQIESMGQMGGIMKENLANAIFLEKNVDLGAETASKLTKNFSLFGENAEKVTSDIIDAKNAFNGMTNIGITNKRLFDEISNASKTIAYFNNNSTEELAKSALEAFKLGTNLKQAEQISIGLLDFENSIRKELEAEILLGKDLNFEKARGLALAGDDVEAAQEILTQTNKLLKGRKLNRLELNAIAEATGLSTDELLLQQKLMTINDKLTQKQTKELERIYKLEEARLGPLSEQQKIDLARQVSQGMTAQQLEKNLTLQESYNSAITKLQETLVGLVEGGIIDTLVDAIHEFASFIEVFVGGQKEEKSLKASKEILERTDLSGEEIKYIKELEEASQDQKGALEFYGENFIKYHPQVQQAKLIGDAVDAIFDTNLDIGKRIDAYFNADNKRAQVAEAELKRIQAGGPVINPIPDERLKSERQVRVDLYLDSTKMASVNQKNPRQ